jgi:hypothetical protein
VDAFRSYENIEAFCPIDVIPCAKFDATAYNSHLMLGKSPTLIVVVNSCSWLSVDPPRKGMYRELMTVESLGCVVGKSLANHQWSNVLLLSGVLNLYSLFRITRKDSSNVVDVVASFLYAKVSPMVGSPGRVVLTARNWMISVMICSFPHSPNSFQ